MSESVASKIGFSKICDVLEDMNKVQTSKKGIVLDKFFHRCRAQASTLKAKSPDADVSLYPIVRLFLPDKDRERSAYNLKEKCLAALYVRIFCLGKQSPDAKKITHYKTPSGTKLISGDFAERVYWTLRSRMAKQSSTYTVEQINIFLDDISGTSSTDKQRDDLFLLLIKRINATELKWITRIILKDLKLGIGSKKILSVFHPDAVAAYDVSSDLRQLCEKLHDPRTRHHQAIETFSHIKPMLLEMCKIEDVGKLFDNGQIYFVQPKFDGERSQMHMRDGKFKYFSRKSFDITHNPCYGETATAGFLTGAFSRVLNPECKSIILDGELMGWHKAKKTFGSKGMSFDVKKLTESSAHRPCFVAFDIIMYNDELLISKPYEERLKILESVVKEEEGSVVICRTTRVYNSKEVREIFNQSIRDQEEGIVLKKYNVTYKPNVRNGGGCYKVKAEYSDDLVHDVDLVVVGGYYGSGRFGGLIKSFLMAVAEPPKAEGTNPTTFLCVVSVSNGFNEEELKELQVKFNELWMKECPANVTPPRLDPPDMWVEPEKSIILTLRATELTRSNDYPTGYSLRFPRVMKVRLDKPWYGVCTTTELQSLIKDARPIQKLTKREIPEVDTADSSKGKIRKVMKARRIKSDDRLSTVGPADIPVVPKTCLLNGKQFCVINGNDEMSKEDIERLLLSHKAKVIQNGHEDCCIIIGNPKTVKAKNVIKSNKYDVVGLNWLSNVTKEENWATLEDFRPWELLCCRESTKERLAQYYDQYYDSFTVDADEESLKRSLDQAAAQVTTMELDPRRAKDLDTELFTDEVSPYSVFRNFVGFFADDEDCAKYDFSFMAGKVTEDINDSTTHVFVRRNTAKVEEWKSLKEQYEDTVKVVDSDWILECLKNRKLMPITEYLLD